MWTRCKSARSLRNILAECEDSQAHRGCVRRYRSEKPGNRNALGRTVLKGIRGSSRSTPEHRPRSPKEDSARCIEVNPIFEPASRIREKERNHRNPSPESTNSFAELRGFVKENQSRNHPRSKRISEAGKAHNAARKSGRGFHKKHPRKRMPPARVIERRKPVLLCEASRFYR